MTIKSKVTFYIKSMDLKPEEVSKDLGIFPDYFHAPMLKESGETIPGIWQLNSALGEMEPLDSHIYRLSERLTSVGARISELSNGKNATLYCSVEVVGDKFHVQVPPKILLELGRMGITLNIKTYTLKETQL